MVLTIRTVLLTSFKANSKQTQPNLKVIFIFVVVSVHCAHPSTAEISKYLCLFVKHTAWLPVCTEHSLVSRRLKSNSSWALSSACWLVVYTFDIITTTVGKIYMAVPSDGKVLSIKRPNFYHFRWNIYTYYFFFVVALFLTTCAKRSNTYIPDQNS